MFNRKRPRLFGISTPLQLATFRLQLMPDQIMDQ